LAAPAHQAPAVLAAGPFGPGLLESAPSRHAGVGLAPVNDRAFSLASPAGRGRIGQRSVSRPRAGHGTAPAGNARRARRRGGHGNLARPWWADTLVGLATSWATGWRPHPRSRKQLRESRRRRTSRMA